MFVKTLKGGLNMKKALFLFIAILAAALLISCSDSVTEQEAEIIASGTDEETPPEPVRLNFDAAYVRTNGYHDGFTYPRAVVISDRAQLDEYYDQNKELYDFSHKEEVYSDTTMGFADAMEKYDDGWFSEKTLLICVLEEGSGSIRHEVTKVEKTGGDLDINIERIVPYACTDDMAEWHIIIELDKTEAGGADSVRIALETPDGAFY